ncbi:MAG TPA: 3-phosphoshikimate 1-carboxyvinyltransferase [Bacteroidales bacterium]|nr:3-phosphoshikimate 1-carboxyvinyltransferase [Bacteroidales bacterium]
MSITIQAGRSINASIQLPASKSISNRALIINALSSSSKDSNLQNLADSDDTLVLIKALELSSKKIDIGAAGTSMRFLTAFLAGCQGEWEITGSERMQNRPINLLVDALNRLGADISYLEKDGFPPLKIKGRKLTGGSISIDGGVSSQFISALLMVAPVMEQGLKLTIEGELISKPYFHMTLEMMRLWGVESSWDGKTATIKPQTYRQQPFTIESDWSGASYWYEMLSLAEEGEIFLKGLTQNSLQGDSKVAEWFENLGIGTEFQSDGVRLTKIPTKVERFDADLSDQPDLAQTIAMTCALKAIPFRLSGLQSLKIKETDRIKALIDESAKLGFVFVASQDNILEWTGETCSMFAKPIETYDDHRMAMAFAPAALVYGIILMNNPEVVSKSYPNFWNDLKEAQFHLTD